MSNKLFKSFFAFAMVLGATLGFVACTDQEEVTVGDPQVELSQTTANFSSAEGSQTVTVKANCKWTVEVEGADWVTISPMSGKNNGSFTVAVAENTTGAVRSVDAKVYAWHETYGKFGSVKLTISQSADENVTVDEELLYSDDFDGETATKEYGSSNSSWPYIDQFPQFANAKGSAAANVTYTGNKVSVRANQPSNTETQSAYAGSGNNNIFFGDGGYFVVNNISPLKADCANYKITFGVQKYGQNADNTLRNEDFLLYLSKDGENWAQIEYVFPANAVEGKYNVVSADFTLASVPEALYIKFAAKVASVYRIDDLKFFAGNGGQNVDLDNVEVVVPELPEMVEVTAEQFLAAAEDSTIYKLTGEITRVANATYGNFDITDATGTVYVYGLLTPNGEQQKQFAAAGLKEGDTISVYGTRTSYNGDPQMKNATYISHVPGEGGNDGPNTPATGVYASDSAFVCSADDATNAVYTLGTTNINGETVSGFKLGKAKQAGKFTSGAVSVSGNKYLNFYAQGWKDGDVTLYFRVNGGATMSQKLVSNNAVTGNPPFAGLAFAATDHYSVLLEGLTETSTIEFSTDANFALTTADSTMASARAIVCGIKLTDEAIIPGEGGGDEPVNPEPDPTPSEPTTVATIADVLALNQGAAISGTIEAVVISNYELNNLTSKKGMYVQDETGALQLRLSADHTYAFGTKLQIDLTGTTLGQYGGAVQVEVNAGNITEVSTGNTVEPKTVTMADFLANKYEGQYVALEGVQVAEADLAKTWVSGGAHTNINMEDAQGNKFIVFSSKYATYGAETVAQGAGTIKGIASINNGNIQIIFAQASDYAGLTGERFASVTPEPEPTPDPTPGEDPVVGDTATIDFNNAANRVSYTTEQQVWNANGITVTNDKGASTSNVGDYTAPARFYKSSNVTIACDTAFSQIVFNCDDYKTTYPTDLQNSITSGSVSVNGTVVTVTLDSAATSFAITNLAGQVRVDSITIAFAK